MNAADTLTSSLATADRLNHWRSTLQTNTLPVNSQVRQQALSKLLSPTGNARNVAAIIEQCPVLSLQLFCETNQRLSQEARCHSLEHAIGLLGVPAVETLLKQALDFDDEAVNEAAKEGFYRALASSQMAADWVKQWCLLSPHWQAYGAVLYWATLFQRAPYWALWLHEPDALTAQEYQRAQRRGASHPHDQTLDHPLPNIAQAVAQQWQLPELCQQSWQADCIGYPRDWFNLQQGIDAQQNARFCHHPAFAVALANQLAEQSSWCWSDHRTERLLRLLNASVNNSKASPLCRQQVATTCRNKNLPFASELLCNYQRSIDLLERRPVVVTAPVTTAETAPIDPIEIKDDIAPPLTEPAAIDNDAAAPDQPSVKQDPTNENHPLEPLPEPLPAVDPDDIIGSANIDISELQPIDPPDAPDPFTSALARLKKQTDSFDDQHQIFKFVLQTLNEQLNLNRCSVALFNSESAELRTLYSLGVADSPALKNFRHRIKGNDFFSMLLKKPTSFQLHAGNYQKFWPLLPNRFKEAIKTPQFFTMSVFVDEKPFALIYGDRAGQVNALTEPQYKQFKQLCSAASHCLNAVKSR